MTDSLPPSSKVKRRLVDTEQTDALSRRWRRDRDPRARGELFERWTPLARRLAGRYWKPTEPVEDLQQVAYIGLLHAIDRYDPERGIPFRALAVPTILGELKRYFRATAWATHVPRGTQELTLRVRQASETFHTRTGRAPRVSDLARYLQLSHEDVIRGLQAERAHHALSLDAPMAAEDGVEAPLIDSVGEVDEGYAAVDARIALQSAMRHMTNQEARALRMRLGGGLTRPHGEVTQAQIGAELGCSQMQASRLLKWAGRKLCEHLAA